jgi:hypothetical protein
LPTPQIVRSLVNHESNLNFYANGDKEERKIIEEEENEESDEK